MCFWNLRLVTTTQFTVHSAFPSIFTILRVVNSIRIHGLIKGNNRGNKEPTQIPTKSEPLPYRQRTSTSSYTIHTTPASSTSSPASLSSFPAMYHDVLPRQDPSSSSNPRLITELESKYWILHYVLHYNHQQMPCKWLSMDQNQS